MDLSLVYMHAGVRVDEETTYVLSMSDYLNKHVLNNFLIPEYRNFRSKQ